MKNYRKDELIGTLYGIGAFIAYKLIDPTFAYLSKISDDIQRLESFLGSRKLDLREAYNSLFGLDKIRILYEDGTEPLIEDATANDILRKFGDWWVNAKLGSYDALKGAEITSLATKPEHTKVMNGIDFVEAFETIVQYGKGLELEGMKLNQAIAQFALTGARLFSLIFPAIFIWKIDKCKYWIKEDLRHLWNRLYEIRS
jgi:hypothetical protein